MNIYSKSLDIGCGKCIIESNMSVIAEVRETGGKINVF